MNEYTIGHIKVLQNRRNWFHRPNSNSIFILSIWSQKVQQDKNSQFYPLVLHPTKKVSQDAKNITWAIKNKIPIYGAIKFGPNPSNKPRKISSERYYECTPIAKTNTSLNNIEESGVNLHEVLKGFRLKEIDGNLLDLVNANEIPVKQSKTHTRTSNTPSNNLIFIAGNSKKARKTQAISKNDIKSIDLLHNEIQKILFEKLKNEYGDQNVGTEIALKSNNQETRRIDAVVQHANEYWFYEIKTSPTASLCIRHAVGQLLEYCCHPKEKRATKLIVVGTPEPDEETLDYIETLKAIITIPFEYEHIRLSHDNALNGITKQKDMDGYSI